MYMYDDPLEFFAAVEQVFAQAGWLGEEE
jgi:hypothetical protein